MGALRGGLSIMGQNQAITAQQKSVNTQLLNAYAEEDIRQTQAKKAAIEKAHVAALDRDAAASRMLVRVTNLGIKGISAGERVGEEVRVGDYNVQSALKEGEDAGNMSEISKMLARNDASSRISALQEQRPSALTSLVSIAGGALQGYLTGTQVGEASGYDGTPFYKRMFGGKNG